MVIIKQYLFYWVSLLFLAPGGILYATQYSYQSESHDANFKSEATMNDDSSRVPMDASEFLRKLHLTNLAEIQIGRLANQSNRTAEVQSFGKMLIRDHLVLDGIVRFIARTKGISLDQEQITTDAELSQVKIQLENQIQQLRRSSDLRFQRNLSTVGVSTHRYVLSLLEQAQTELSDPVLKLLARLSEPIIKHHLKMAQEL